MADLRRGLCTGTVSGQQVLAEEAAASTSCTHLSISVLQPEEGVDNPVNETHVGTIVHSAHSCGTSASLCLVMSLCICSHLLQGEASLMMAEEGIDLCTSIVECHWEASYFYIPFPEPVFGFS